MAREAAKRWRDEAATVTLELSLKQTDRQREREVKSGGTREREKWFIPGLFFLFLVRVFLSLLI